MREIATGILLALYEENSVYEIRVECSKNRKGDWIVISKEEYKKTEDYILSIKLLKEFIEEELEGDINGFSQFDFTQVKNAKYIGKIKDPDMYLISQAIYILLWGDIWNLSFKNMGSWGSLPKNQHPYRGDTIYAFGKIGVGEGKQFGYRAKYFEIEKNRVLWKKIKDFYKSYHRIGNFIVIPNRSNRIGGINAARADWRNGMRDYFDWFLITLYNYQIRKKGFDLNIITDFDDAFIGRIGFEKQLDLNPEYSPNFLEIAKWKDVFFLDTHFNNGIPISYFISSPNDRRKITTTKEKRLAEKNYFNNEEYTLLLDEYITKANLFIEVRSEIIIDKLKAILNWN